MIDTTLAASALLSARKGADGWYRAACPYCLEATGKSDKRQSLGIKPAIRYFKCFKCGAAGRLTEEEIASADVQPHVEAKPEDYDPGPPPGYEPLWTTDAWTSMLLEDPRRYIEGRGITRTTCMEARIGVCLAGKYAYRVIVPALDLDHRTWLGYVARDWTNKAELRYRYPRGMPRRKFLWNQRALYAPTERPVLLVEGVFDALPYWPDVVACLGKPGEYHRRLLTDEAITRPIAVALDGDAWQEGESLSEFLKLYGRQAGYVRLPPCSDPNTVEPTWLREESIRCIQC